MFSLSGFVQVSCVLIVQFCVQTCVQSALCYLKHCVQFSFDGFVVFTLTGHLFLHFAIMCAYVTLGQIEHLFYFIAY